MPTYTLSPMFRPQYVGAAVAALQFATQGSPSAVPSGLAYQITVARLANVTQQPVNLTIWRVPATGGAEDNQHIVVPQLAVPPASTSFPWLDLSTLWGAILSAGDSIYALAGAANALVIHGDGMIISP